MVSGVVQSLTLVTKLHHIGFCGAVKFDLARALSIALTSAGQWKAKAGAENATSKAGASSERAIIIIPPTWKTRPDTTRLLPFGNGLSYFLLH